MKRLVKVAALLASGVVFGAIAGKIATNELVRVKRRSFSDSSNNVKNYLNRTRVSESEENINEYFI